MSFDIHTGALIAGYWDREKIDDILPLSVGLPVAGGFQHAMSLSGPVSMDQIASLVALGGITVFVTSSAKFPAIFDGNPLTYLLVSPSDYQEIGAVIDLAGVRVIFSEF